MYICASALAFRTAYSQQVLLQFLSDWKQQHAEDFEIPCVHFIETEPSMLHEMPYVLHRDYKVCTFYVCKKEKLNACCCVLLHIFIAE